MQKGQIWLFTSSHSLSLSLFLYTPHSHFKKEHVTFIGKQHLVCSPLSPQNSVPAPSPVGPDVFPIKLQIHSAFTELFIRHMSPPRYLLRHNSAPKFRR